MSNFEYIIASLPYLTADYRYADGQGFGDVVAEIRENLSERDAAEMDFLLKGFDGDALDADFYAEALSKAIASSASISASTSTSATPRSVTSTGRSDANRSRTY